MESPRVTILLTTYNRPALLEVALQSVLDQTFGNWECIVLDDNSDNEEQKLVLESEEFFTDKRFKLYVSDVKPEDRKKTARYATLINTGLKMAKGEFITYLCDDDFYYPDRLLRMVEFLDTHPEASVVYGRQQVITITNGQEELALRNPNQVLDNANCQVDHSSVMMRKTAVDTVGDWDDSPEWWGGADGQYWEKLGKAGFSFHPIAIVTDAHLVHDGSWTRGAKWQKLGTAEEPK